MSDMPKIEQGGPTPAGLGEGGQPLLGAAPQSAEGWNAGGQATHAENVGMPGENISPEMGTQSELESMMEFRSGVPLKIAGVPLIPEVFPDEDPVLLERLRKKSPDGMFPAFGIMGGADGGVEQLMEALMGLQGRSDREMIKLRGMEQGMAKRVIDHRASLWDVATHGAPKVFRHPVTGGFITTVSLYRHWNTGALTLEPEDLATIIPTPGAPAGMGRPMPNKPEDPYADPLFTGLSVKDDRGNILHPAVTLGERRGTAAYALAFNAMNLRLMTGVEDQQHFRAVFSMPEGSSDVDASAEALFGFAAQGAAAIATAQEHEDFVNIAKSALSPRLMIAMRIAARPVEGYIVRNGVLLRVGGLIHLADYLDAFIGSQKVAEKVLSKKLVDELRMPYAPVMRQGGALWAPIEVIESVMAKRLGLRFDSRGNPLDQIVSMNYYDPFSGGAVTTETAGEAGPFDVALGCEYSPYLIARGIWHLFGMDRISTDGLRSDLPPGRRKAEFPAWYVGPEYNLPPAGRAESESAADYGSFVAEKILPKTIDGFVYKGSAAELQQLRRAIGSELPEVFDTSAKDVKRTLAEAQRSVVERILTRITIGPEWSEYMDFAPWALMTKDVASRQRALGAYTLWANNSAHSVKDPEFSIKEMQQYLEYMERENPLSHSHYLSSPDKGSRTFEQWLQRKELEGLYNPRMVMYRSAELRTIEEMKRSVDALLPFEEAILNGQQSGGAAGWLPLDVGSRMKELGMITDQELTTAPDRFKGVSGMKEFVNRFSIRHLEWRPSIKDLNSWLDYQKQRMEIMLQNKKVWRFLQDSDQSVGEGNIPYGGVSISMMKAVNEALQHYADDSYNFVPSGEKARMAIAYTLYTMRLLCPLAPESWMLAITKFRPQRSEQREYSEMYVPSSMIDVNDVTTVLSPLGYRIHGEMITTPNRFPVRVRAKRRDIESLFRDMKTPKEVKEAGMPLTVLNLQFPHLRTPGWKEALEAMIGGIQDAGVIRPEDAEFLRAQASRIFDQRYKKELLTTAEKKGRMIENIGDTLKAAGEVGGSIAGAIGKLFGS